MKYFSFALTLLFVSFTTLLAQVPPTQHPDTSSDDWRPLFTTDLTNADHPAGVWMWEDGELTATEDQNIWTQEDYDNFIVDLEFKTAEGTNSGVIVYISDTGDWIPNSVEVDTRVAQHALRRAANSRKDWFAG